MSPTAATVTFPPAKEEDEGPSLPLLLMVWSLSMDQARSWSEPGLEKKACAALMQGNSVLQSVLTTIARAILSLSCFG